MMKLCLFDCDGTLVDSAHTIVAAMECGFASVGLTAPPARAVRGVIGLPLRTAIAHLLDDEDRDREEAIAAAYKAVWGDLTRGGANAEPLYPGIDEVLTRLAEHGWVLGIATGKSRRGALTTLAAHGLTERFVTIQTADDGAGKPAPDLIVNALRETGAERQRTVMIGDSVYDMAMARNAHVRALGVGWGYSSPQHLRDAGAELVVDDAEAILAVLEKWMAKAVA
jgi:phosphoglycolate phosphatase